MTEQEQITAIDVLCALLPWKQWGKTWQESNDQEKETLRYAAIQSLRQLHSDNFLTAEDIYEFFLHGKWEEVTEQDRLICENAVTAMTEVIESEQ